MLVNELFEAKKWSGKVDGKWKPEEGFFDQSGAKIAAGLLAASKDEAQAMQRLNFYMNRAGKNLDDKAKARLEVAKAKLEAAREKAKSKD
jgi:F0F1-type ATP synthase membrane subunit b/b'